MYKKKDKLSKKVCERYQSLSDEEKNKKANMLMSDIEIFLKKKKKKSSHNVVVNDIKI